MTHTRYLAIALSATLLTFAGAAQAQTQAQKDKALIRELKQDVKVRKEEQKAAANAAVATPNLPPELAGHLPATKHEEVRAAIADLRARIETDRAQLAGLEQKAAAEKNPAARAALDAQIGTLRHRIADMNHEVGNAKLYKQYNVLPRKFE